MRAGFKQVWVLAALALSLICLVACEAGQSGPAPSAQPAPPSGTEPAPSDQNIDPSPTPEPPPPAPAPAPDSSTATGNTETEYNTTLRGRMEENGSIILDPNAPTITIERRPARMPGDGPSGVDPNRVITPVLVELLATEARLPRQGGSAVVLLAHTGHPADGIRNMALCQELFLTFDRASAGEVGVGVRSGPEGETQLLRPLYWLTREGTGARTGADRCAQRLETFDFPRADSIRRKFGLSAAGPYLLVERQDMNSAERVAAVVDLSRARAQDVPQIVGYFRDSFMQSTDVWDRNRFQTSRAREDMGRTLGPNFAVSLLPRLVRTTRQVGCAFTNLLDRCDTTQLQ